MAELFSRKKIHWYYRVFGKKVNRERRVYLAKSLRSPGKDPFRN